MDFRIRFKVERADVEWHRYLSSFNQRDRSILLRVILRDAVASGRANELAAALGITPVGDDLSPKDATLAVPLRPTKARVPVAEPPVFVPPATSGPEMARDRQAKKTPEAPLTRQHPVIPRAANTATVAPTADLETIELDPIPPAPAPAQASVSADSGPEPTQATTFNPGDPRQLLGFFG